MTVNPSPLDAETQFCLYTAPTIQIRCSQLGVILLFWGHLAVFEDTFSCHNWQVLLKLTTRDAAKHCIIHKTVPHNKELSDSTHQKSRF